MNVTSARPTPPIAAPEAARPAAETRPREAAPAAVGAARARSLWELLTPEERDFFAQQEALGPLTYRPGRARADAPAAPVGRRIDVRG